MLKPKQVINVRKKGVDLEENCIKLGNYRPISNGKFI